MSLEKNEKVALSQICIGVALMLQETPGYRPNSSQHMCVELLIRCAKILTSEAEALPKEA